MGHSVGTARKLLLWKQLHNDKLHIYLAKNVHQEIQTTVLEKEHFLLISI